jgi:hypothetical protein
VKIRIANDDSGKVEAFKQKLWEWRNEGRFTFGIEVNWRPRLKVYEVCLSNFRLKEKKPYCGNHPNGCEFGGPKKKADPARNYLEGVDWVSVNDAVNDLLDSLEIEADASTSVCIVRKGRKRRICYGSHHTGTQWQWDMDADEENYEDFMGEWLMAPGSDYPVDTPGIYTREIVKIELEKSNAR